MNSQNMIRRFCEDLTIFMNGKTSFCLQDFKQINQQFSGELFLCIMVLFQNNIACSHNFFHFLKEYRSSDRVADL